MAMPQLGVSVPPSQGALPFAGVRAYLSFRTLVVLLIPRVPKWETSEESRTTLDDLDILDLTRASTGI